MADNWDIIIVGSGIIGTATAKTIKENNSDLSVLLIDKYPGAGQGNTSKSNACYRNVFSTSTNINLCNSSISYYKHLENSGVDLELQEFGYLWLLSEKQYEDRNQPIIQLDNSNQVSFLEFLRINEVEYEILEKSQLEVSMPALKMNPDKIGSLLPLVDISYGLLGKNCGSISPDLLVKAYEELFLELGGKLSYDTEVAKIMLKEKSQEYDPDYFPTVWRDSEVAGIEVIRDGESQLLFTDKLVLCTGAWIQQLLDPLGIDSLVRPKKRQLYRVCDIEEFVINSNFDNEIDSIPFLILPVGGVFAKPIPNASCTDVGCSDDLGRRFETRIPTGMKRPTAFNHYLDDPKGEIDFYIYNVLPILQAYFPTIFNEKIRIDRPSAGMYAYSPDKNPIIECNKELGNLYFATGASGSGIMKADSIARITAALVGEQELAELYGGIKVKTSDFGMHSRNMDKEQMVL